MLSRRELGGKVAVGAAALLAAGAARASLGSVAGISQSPVETGPTDIMDVQNSPDSGDHEPDQVVAVEPEPAATVVAPPPWELLAPLALGSTVAHGWTLAGFTGAVDGTCVVTLENGRGRQNRVHICRNAGDPNGLVYTRNFDLVVMNGGKGDLPTEESFGQAVAELAHVLAANEGSSTVVASLMPHAERMRMCSDTADHRLR